MQIEKKNRKYKKNSKNFSSEKLELSKLLLLKKIVLVIFFFAAGLPSFGAKENLNGIYDVYRPQNIDSTIKVFLDPVLYRDDRLVELTAGYPSSLRFLFYKSENVENCNIKDILLTIDLPEFVKIEKAVVFNHWLPRSEIKTEPLKISENGKKLRRYRFLWKNSISSVARRSLWSYFSLKQHQFYLILDVAPTEKDIHFDFTWRIGSSMGNGPVHKEKGKILAFSLPSKRPKRFLLWGPQIRELPWISMAKQYKAFELLKGLGFSILQSYPSKEFNEQLHCEGFKLYSYGILNWRPIAEKNVKRPVKGSIWKTISGKTGYSGDNPQQSFCPSWILRTDTFLFEETKKYLDSIYKNTDYIYADWEGKTWRGCYCKDCLRSFARYAGMKEENILKMDRVTMLKTYPLEWIKFRNWQTGEMAKMWKRLLNRNLECKTKVGLDFTYEHTDTIYTGIGRGINNFCDDPKFMKNAELDFVVVDSICSGPKSYDDASAIIPQVKDMTIFCKVGSIGSHRSSLCIWVSRRMEADFQGKPLGIDFQPRLARLMTLAFAANGAKGAIMDGPPFDGRTVIECGILAEQLAMLEDFYFDGIRTDEKVKVTDVSIKNKKRDYENSFISSLVYYGTPWEDLIRITSHTKEHSTLFSFFNFDIVQERIMHLSVPKLETKQSIVYNPVSLMGYLSPSGNKTWTKEELASGFFITATPVDANFIVISHDQNKKINKWTAMKPGKHSKLKDGRLLKPIELKTENVKKFIEKKINAAIKTTSGY